MDKEYLTDADIEILKRASRSLKPDEIVIGTIVNTMIDTKTGMPRTTKSIHVNEKRIDNITKLPNVALNGEGISGEANTEAIEKAKIAQAKRNHLVLKEAFNLLNEIETERNYRKLNSGTFRYHYDDLGRVYFYDTTGERFYINKAKNGCIDKFGTFYEIISTGEYEDQRMIPHPEFNSTYFDYLYISKKSAEEDLARIEAERQAEITRLKELNEAIATFKKDSSSQSKIVSFEQYRKDMDEGPRR